MSQTTLQIPDQVHQVVTSVKHVLGKNISAVYLFGSAVMGGLRPNSDLDFFVLVDQSLSDQERPMLVAELMKVSSRKALNDSIRPVELTIVRESAVIPWQYPPEQDFQYGEWLRSAFEEGSVPRPVSSPDLAILISKVRKDSISFIGKTADELFDPVPIEDIYLAIEATLPTLFNDLYGDERNVILTLARMWMTLSTGEITSKDCAANWALERLPSTHQPVLDLARKAYLGECQDDWSSFREQVKGFVNYAEKTIRRCLKHDTLYGSLNHS